MTTHAHSHKHVLGIPPQKQEAEIRKAMSRIFSEQKNIVIGRLPSVKDPKKDKLFDVEAWSRTIVKSTKAPITQIVIAGGTKALKSIRRFPAKPKDKKYYLPEAIALSKAVDWPISTKAGPVIPEWLDDPDVLEAIDGQTYDFALAINDHTEESLRDALYEGMEAGETMDQLAERIEGLYEGWEGYRAEMIARTESARAYTTGHIEAWRSTGVVDECTWISSSDACPFCLDMNGETITLGENFWDEGDEQEIEWNGKDISLSQDYGDVIGPPLHPQCRCALVGVLNEEKMMKMLSRKGESEGHPFRGNQYTSGSSSDSSEPDKSSGSSVTSSELRTDKKLVKALQKDIDSWSRSDAQAIATSALMNNAGPYDDLDGIAMRNADGKLAGIVSYEIQEGKDYIKVKDLASNEKGYGTKLMNEVASRAADLGRGVALVSMSEDASVFYRKIGMTENPPSIFRWTADEAKKRASEKSAAHEPEDGCFVSSKVDKPIEDDEINKKGGIGR